MPNANDFPLITRILGTAEHPGGIALQCGLADGGELLFAIEPAAIGALFAAIAERGAKSPALKVGDAMSVFPVQAVGVDSFSTQDGLPGIAIQMAGGWRLSISLSPTAVTDLRAKLAAMSHLMDPPSTSAH